MKIHSTKNCKSGASNNGKMPTVPLSRLARLSRLSFVCAAWACVASAATVHAQSSSDGLEQAGGFSSATAEVQGGMLQHGDEAYRVVDTASYRTAADAESTESTDIQQVGFQRHASSGSCSTCGTSSCGGSCGSVSMNTGSCGTCGTVCGGSGGRCGLGLGSICNSNRVSGLSCRGALSNDPCAPCSPYRYASIEALYMQRDDRSFSRGTLALPDFDYEFGPRIVIGAVYDCVNGYESSLVGPFSWDTSSSLAPLQTLQSSFSFPGGTVIDETTVSYENQTQSLDTDYFSVDASRTINGWEIAKLLYGGRYVDYGENYAYSGIQRVNTDTFLTGSAPRDSFVEQTVSEGLRSEVENRMVGMQVGLDLLYPISRFAYSDVRMRAGAYANFAESNFAQTQVSSVARSGAALVTDAERTTTTRGSDSDVELAGLFEFGSGIRYQVGEILSLRAGVELWYLSGVASATDNVSRPNGPISIDEDVLFTGLSFGSELRW